MKPINKIPAKKTPKVEHVIVTKRGRVLRGERLGELVQQLPEGDRVVYARFERGLEQDGYRAGNLLITRPRRRVK